MKQLNRNRFCLYAISFLWGMVFYGPIATLYRQQAGISVFQITLIESISLVVMMGMEVPWGMIADRIGYRKTMIICTVLYFFSKVIFWQAHHFSGFLLERLILSVALAGISGVDSSILYLSCPPDQAQQHFAIYNNLGTAGLLFASAVYSWWIQDRYRLAGFLTVISYGLAVLFVWPISEVKEPATAVKEGSWQNFQRALQDLIHQPTLLAFIIGVALLNETHQTITVFLNQLQYLRCGLSATAMGYIYIFVTICGLLGGCSSHLTHWLGEKRTLWLLTVVPLLSCLVLGWSQNAILSVGSMTLLHISFSLLQPLQMQIQNREIHTGNRATALSLNAIMMDLLAVWTNLIFGRIADWSLSGAFYLGAFFCLVALVLFFRKRESR